MGEVFETTDVELAEDLLLRHYGTSFRIGANGPQGGMRLAQAVLTPAVRFEYSHLAVSFTATVGPLGVLAFGHLAGGLLAYRSDGGERRLRPGDVFLGVQPRHPFGASIESTRIEMAMIDPVLLSQVADTEPGRAQQPVRITGYEPVTPQAAQQWKDTYAYVREGVLDPPGTDGYPLVAADAARLLAATALAVSRTTR